MEGIRRAGSTCIIPEGKSPRQVPVRRYVRHLQQLTTVLRLRARNGPRHTKVDPAMMERHCPCGRMELMEPCLGTTSSLYDGLRILYDSSSYGLECGYYVRVDLVLYLLDDADPRQRVLAVGPGLGRTNVFYYVSLSLN